MADHEHGKMDITDQEKTFEGFVTWTTRVVIACIAIAVFLAIFGA